MGVTQSKILVPGTPRSGWPCIKKLFQEKRVTLTNSRIEMDPKSWVVTACSFFKEQPPRILTGILVYRRMEMGENH